MVAVVKISIRGGWLTSRNSEGFRKLLVDEIGTTMFELGVVGRTMAKTLAPVKTGALRNSINFVVGKSGLRMTLSATATYAAFVNFGTKFTKANPFWDKTALFLQESAPRFIEEAVQRASVRFNKPTAGGQ